jgi:hypothetical protein
MYPRILYIRSDEKYRFPGQQEVVDFCVREAMKAVVQQPRTLVVVGTYSIGKERVFTGMYTPVRYLLLTRGGEEGRRGEFQLEPWLVRQ